MHVPLAVLNLYNDADRFFGICTNSYNLYVLFSFVCSLFSNDLSYVTFSSSMKLLRSGVVAVKRRHVHKFGADYKLCPLGSFDILLSIFLK